MGQEDREPGWDGLSRGPPLSRASAGRLKGPTHCSQTEAGSLGGCSCGRVPYRGMGKAAAGFLESDASENSEKLRLSEKVWPCAAEMLTTAKRGR